MFNQTQSVKPNMLFKKRIVTFMVKTHHDTQKLTSKSVLNKCISEFAVAVFNSKNFIDNTLNVYRYSPDRKVYEMFVTDYRSALFDLKNCIDIANRSLQQSDAEYEPFIRLAKSKTNTLKKYIRSLSKGRWR